MVRKRTFEVVIEKDPDGYFIADVPELKGCHTQARDLNTLQKRIKEAIELCLMDEKETVSPNEFFGVQIVTV